MWLVILLDNFAMCRGLGVCWTLCSHYLFQPLFSYTRKLSIIWAHFIYGFWANLSTNLIHVQLSSQMASTLSTFCKPKFVTCKKWGPILGPNVSWEESVVTRINLVWTNIRDVHYPMDKSNVTQIESSDQWKARPNFFKPSWRFGAKLCAT